MEEGEMEEEEITIDLSVDVCAGSGYVSFCFAESWWARENTCLEFWSAMKFWSNWDSEGPMVKEDGRRMRPVFMLLLGWKDSFWFNELEKLAYRVTSWMQPSLKPQILYATTLDSLADINRQLGRIQTTSHDRDFTKSIEPMSLAVPLVFINV